MKKWFAVFMLTCLPITPGMAQLAQHDEAERAADNRDKMVCKSFPRTGSLVAHYHTCKTKWEWERERENVRQLSVSDACRDRGEGGSLCGP